MRNVIFLFTLFVPLLVVSIGSAQDRSEASTPRPEFGTAKRGSFSVLYSTKGEAQSAENVVIRSNTSGVILRLVPEGTKVKQGDWLVTLSSKKQEDEVDAARIAVGSAEAEVVAAQALMQSATAKLLEYEEGTYVLQEITLGRKIDVAEKSLALQQEEYKAADATGMTKLELKRLAMKLEKSKYEVEIAKQQLDVLQKFTKPKRKAELHREVSQAEVDASLSRKKLEIQLRRLEKAKGQLEACTILAPDGFDGELYYAQSRTETGHETTFGIGSQVHEGQTIGYLPDLSKMNVTVHLPQAVAVRIQRGMPAKIRVFDETCFGFVFSLTTKRTQPGPPGVFRGLIGVCTVQVVDPPPFIKPGMAVGVTIKLDEVRDKLYLPAKAVLNHDNQMYYCIRKGEDSFATRRLATGAANDNFVEIINGISEGETYLLNPEEWPEFVDLPSVDDPSLEEFKLPNPGNEPANTGGDRRPAKTDGPSRRTSGNQRRSGMRATLDEMVIQMMKRYDSNADGFIDQAEQEKTNSRMQTQLKGADSDGDGKISHDELKVRMEAMVKQFQLPGGRGKQE